MKIEKKYDNGLMLLKAKSGCMIWRYSYKMHWVEKRIFIGKLPETTEEMALKIAKECAFLVAQKIDPKYSKHVLTDIQL